MWWGVGPKGEMWVERPERHVEKAKSQGFQWWKGEWDFQVEGIKESAFNVILCVILGYNACLPLPTFYFLYPHCP